MDDIINSDWFKYKYSLPLFEPLANSVCESRSKHTFTQNTRSGCAIVFTSHIYTKSVIGYPKTVRIL